MALKPNPKNKLQKGGIRMFKDEDKELNFDTNRRRLYPDFYKENFILDAKYKHLNSAMSREDLYQVVTYMYCTHSRYGGYIYPIESESNVMWYSLAGYEVGNEGIMAVIPFVVPQLAENWDSYSRLINSSEKGLIETISNPKSTD